MPGLDYLLSDPDPTNRIMESLFYRLMNSIRRMIWAMLVAYMLGIHNFYKGEDKTEDNIVITIEHIEAQEDDSQE